MNVIPQIVIDSASVVGRELTPSYGPGLVAISFALAVYASFVSLRAIGHFRTTTDVRRQRALIGVASLSLGGGIWGMHFVGMLALRLPVEVSYDPMLTWLSLIIPIGVCSVGLYWIRIPIVSFRRLIAAGVVTGLGIVTMHYLGMAAMHAPVEMFYRADLFSLSIAIGIAAAATTFWLGRRLSDPENPEPEPKIGVAIALCSLMAVAICGMHYVGVASMIVIDRPDLERAVHFSIEPNIMAVVIAMTLMVVLGAAQMALSVHEGSTGRARMAALPLLMAAVAAGSGGTAVAVLYDTALDLERQELLEVVRLQRDLIEAVSRFDEQHSIGDVAGGAMAATIAQIKDAHSHFDGYGATGEFYLARTADEVIEYIVPLRFPLARDARVERHGLLDRPMQMALNGETGTTIGPDYRGERVLAAYIPIAPLGLGMVVKIDMREIRSPFVAAAFFAGIATLILIAVGIFVSVRISDPVLHELDEKARLDLELDFARTVQLGLLPAGPPSHATVELAARTLPAREVSGDFYDFIELDKDRVAMVVGDVSGKGVSAALLMARLLSDVRYAFARSPDPAAVLEHVNLAVLESAQQGMFATACCLLIDTKRMQLDIASAGHLPLTHRDHEGKVREIGRASGPPLGVLETPGYARERMTLSPNDVVIAYTDGIVEPRDAAGNEYGIARLHAAIGKHDLAPEHLIDTIHIEINSFTGHAPQPDDSTLLVLRMSA